MNIIYNNQLIYSNQTISLAKNSSNLIYQITCSSVNSNPDVNLTLYDTNSLISLSNNLNSVFQKTCNDSIHLCSNTLQVNFQFVDNRFDNMNSLTCAANSANPQVPLIETISRNVTVKIPSNFCIIVLFKLRKVLI